jgi:hypothetical protein
LQYKYEKPLSIIEAILEVSALRKDKFKWLETGELFCRKCVLISLMLLSICQFVLLKDSFRFYLSKVDQIEGESIGFNLPAYSGEPLKVSNKTETAITPFRTLRESKILIIKMIAPSSSQAVYARMNGNIIGDFAKGELKLTVFNGDYLEIDAAQLQQPAKFILNVPNSGLAFPEDGTIVQTNKDLVSIGIIKFK